MNKTRLFNIVWNNAKIPNYVDRMVSHRAEGTHYANGRVSLDWNVTFDSMPEMEEYLGRCGSMRYAYQDEHGAQDLTLDDVSHEPSRIPARARVFKAAKIPPNTQRHYHG